MSVRPGPLDGMVVLDLTQMLSGPFCTLLLADMGADVVKIEKPPMGDDSRTFGTYKIKGESAPFLMVNRNKRGVVLNLKAPEGKETLKRMVKKADVLVENFRPGTMDSLGLGYEALKEANSTLIYCAISGFGQTGPYRDRGGFDLVAQGMSGLMSLTGFPDSPPVKMGVAVTDLNAGILGSQGILCAYVQKLKSGEGQMVDTSLLEAGVAYTFWEAAIFFSTGEVGQPMGSAHRLSAPYQALKAKDRYFTMGAANQPNWERMCHAIGRADLMEDPRFRTNVDRLSNYQELAAVLEQELSKKPADYWLALLERAGVPAGPIYTVDEVYRDPHLLERGMITEVEHPTAGRLQQLGIPVKLSLTPGRVRRSAPLLGQHTVEVLHEFGFAREEVSSLLQKGVAHQWSGPKQ
ncbi:MAG: CoA transferase [Chloroflexi bacterium]|nr:CoA transferase [Chloroflexota bacterium]